MVNNNINNNLDRVFRERLAAYEVKPNDYNWSVVESKLYRGFKKQYQTPLFYAKYAAILLTAVCISVFATKHFTINQNISDSVQNGYSGNEDAFWNYMKNITKTPDIITKEVEVIKEVTKLEYVYNNEFYRMPPEYKYEPKNGETIIAYNDIKNMLALYESDDAIGNIAANKFDQRFQSNEIASINKIENSFYDTEIASVIPVLFHPIYGNYDMGLSLDGGENSNDSNAMTKKGINSLLNQKLVKRTGFHFGLGGMVLNTWVLNNQPTEVDGNTVMYPITLGYQYGSNLGFDFGSKFGVEMGLYKARQGQKITQIVNLKKIESELEMDYIHVPVTFKYKWEQFSNLTKNPVILNYIFGVQYSRLQNFESNISETLLSKSSIERTQDVGFLIGLEYDIFLSKNYYLTFGARSTYAYNGSDFKNMFNGVSNNSKANNFTIGLNASVNYLIPNK